ncbi:uncharacterized protein PG998_000818 [Apiospora kogelbergensis]|uniref:uncharacterized protein n=1 Tax=Apiospora kogelbergensis TaxID=1337665 RepID=UPI003130EC28
MSNARPASPAPSQHPDGGADFSSGFQHLVSYNQSAPAVGVPYPPRHQTQSPYNNHGMHMYPSPYEGTPSHGGTPGYYHDDSFDSQYPDPDPGSVTPHSGFHSPPMPPSKRYALRNSTMASNDPDPLRSVQSGGVTKPKPKPKPKAKGKKKPASDSDPKFNFDEPLSVMCKRVTDVQDADIEAWVNRSIEERRHEVDVDKNHKIKRPMNAFMLYRKHHQNRVKLRFSHENHQIVSAVCGQGWAQEPKEVIEQYNEWARIERDNHARAFPDYKFTPSKSKKPVKKPGGYDSDEDWEVPEPKEVFGGLPPGASRMPNTRGRSADHPDADYHPGGRPIYSAYHQPHGGSHARSLSHYSYQNPNKPLPSGYNTSLPQHEYYAQSVQTVGPPSPLQPPAEYATPWLPPRECVHDQDGPAGARHAPPPLRHAEPPPLFDTWYARAPSRLALRLPALRHHVPSPILPAAGGSPPATPPRVLVRYATSVVDARWLWPAPDTGGNDFYNELNAHDDIFNLGANSHYMGDMGTPVNGAPGDFDDNGPHHSQFVDPSAFDPALGMTAPSHLSGLGDLEALDPSLQDPIDWRTQELEPVPDERAMNELLEGTTSSPTDTIAVAAPGGTGSESGGG